MTKRLEDQGYAVLQMSDGELRRTVMGCEACGWCDSMDSLAPCLNHPGATMNTSLYDAIQRAANDVVKEPRFLNKFGIGLILGHGRSVAAS